MKLLSGVTIPDVEMKLIDCATKPQAMETRRGSMLFAHFGLSGPVALDISRHISGHARPQSLQLICDFLPTVSQPELDSELRNQATIAGKKQLLSILPEQIPRRLAETLVQNAGLNPEQKAAELSKAGRAALVQAIKQTKIAVTGTLGFEKAEVTAGGISLNEVDSRTMQSKLVPGLYLAGEILDESTGKIFPVSNKATDVLNAFLNRLHRSGCQLALEEPLTELSPIDDGFRLVTSRRTLDCKHVIITSGGKSYPGSGTTGDGYRWAQQFGHTIIPPRPALVPITTGAAWVKLLSGVTIPDVEMKLIDHATKPQAMDTRRGSLLFAHFGLSGPVALDISRQISGHARPQSLQLICDFLPTVSQAELDD